MNSPNRTEKLRSFLRRHSLQGWLTWRPDEILLLSGHLPFWGASFLLYLAESPSILFVPVLEPRDHIPPDFRVIEYPWGSSDCADPFAVLMDTIRIEQETLNIEFSRIGMNRNSSRPHTLSKQQKDFLSPMPCVTGFPRSPQHRRVNWMLRLPISTYPSLWRRFSPYVSPIR